MTRISYLADSLRQEALPNLIREAAWRGIRSIRKTMFARADKDGVCPVVFKPIGYYQLRRELVSECPRGAIVGFADAVLRGEYRLLGYGSPHLGVNPDWHCDWVSGKRWPFQPSGTIPIVRHDGSDVKAPWELSRLQFSPVVARAFVLTGDQKYREALKSLLANWMAHNPVGMGVNWTVAMEAALRSISLCLTLELLWPFSGEEQPWLEQMTAGLWQHLRFIETHSEFSYRLRSNHYLSNIVGLTTLSAYLGMDQRREKYARAVQQEILLQTYADGGDCEASTGYHVLVAQMFLHSFMVQQASRSAVTPEFQARLRLMFEWIASVADDAWRLPHLGDCDNGRVELLADDIAQLAQPASERHSLSVGALCRLASQLLETNLGRALPISLLRDSGIAVLRSGEASVVFCAMPNGLRGKGSHTHCDKLSIVFRLGRDEVFCDSGSRCYTRSAELRNLDRSTRAHNTLMIDGADQNVLSSDPRLLFQSGNEAAVSAISIPEGGKATAESSVEASHHGYSRFGIEHRRTVELKQRSLEIHDEISGTDEHSLDLRYVVGPEWSVSSEVMTGDAVSCVISGPRRLTLACAAQSRLTLSILPAEISREYGAALPAHCILIHTIACLPATLRTGVRWD